MEKLGKGPAGQRLQSSARDAALAEPGKKKTNSSFYSQAGVVGCLRTRRCHYGRPREPPRLLRLPLQSRLPLVPAKHRALGQVENTGGCPGRGLTARNSWNCWVSARGLQLPKAELGLGKAQGSLRRWGHTQACRGAGGDDWECLGTERAGG